MSDGFAHCFCDRHHAGPFCDAPAVTLATPAYKPYYPTKWHDDYGDDHPLFNMSDIAVMRLTIAPSDLEFLIAPTNIDADQKKPANMLLMNGGLGVVHMPVDMSLKGAYSRKCLKKSWKLHVSDKFLGMKVFSLKSACQDLTMMRNIVAMDFNRYFGLPFQRVGMLRLWVNGIDYGFYVLNEEIEKPWLKAHFGKQSIDGLLKNHRAQLVPSANYSATGNYKLADGDPQVVWPALAAIVNAVNAPDNATFLANTSSLFHVDHFLRYMAVEFLSGNPDSYSWRGNNWWLVFVDGIGLYIPYDEEESYGLGMYITPEQWEQMPPEEFFNCQNINPPVDCGKLHPLSQKLLQLNASEFESHLSHIVNHIWQSGKASSRVSQLASVFELQLVGDQWYGLDEEGFHNAQTFLSVDVKFLLDYIAARGSSAARRLAGTRSSRIHSRL